MGMRHHGSVRGDKSLSRLVILYRHFCSGMAIRNNDSSVTTMLRTVHGQSQRIIAAACS